MQGMHENNTGLMQVNLGQVFYKYDILHGHKN